MVNEDRQVASIAELVVAAEGAEDEVAVAVGVPELDAELASEAIELEGLLWMSLMQRTTMRMNKTRTTRTMHRWVVSYWYLLRSSRFAYSSSARHSCCNPPACLPQQPSPSPHHS